MAGDNKRVTIKEVAKRAGVSNATVSRALNNDPLVQKKTKNKVIQVAHQLGYHPNVLARSIRTRDSNTIGVIISNVVNTFFTEVIRAIEDKAKELNYNVIIVNTDENSTDEEAAIKMLRGHMVNGFIIASVGKIKSYSSLLGGLPTVFIDRVPPTSDAYDTILSDNVAGAKKVVTSLIDQGAKKIGIISSGVSTAGQERLLGYKQALSEFKIAVNDDLIFFSDVETKMTRQYTKELLLNYGCDGIFAADNTILLAVMKEISAQKLDSLRLGAFDNTQWFDFFRQPVTTIQQPTTAIGQQAVKQLVNRIKQPNLQTHLVRMPGKLITRF